MYMRVINVSCDLVSSIALSPCRVAQSAARLTQEPEAPGSILCPFPLSLIQEGQLSATGKSMGT